MENVIKMFNSKKAEKFVMVEYSGQRSGIKVFEHSVGNTDEEVFRNVDTSRTINLYNIDLKEEWEEYQDSEGEISFDNYIELLNKNRVSGESISYNEDDYYYKCSDSCGDSYILFQNDINYNDCLEMAGGVTHWTGIQPQYKIIPVSTILEKQGDYDVSENFLTENIVLEEEYFFPYVQDMECCDDANMDIKVYKEDGKWIIEEQFYAEDAHCKSFAPRPAYEWEVKELVKTLMYDNM